MPDFYTLANFYLEIFAACFGAFFGWLTWAAGYMNYLWNGARTNHWGRDLLTGKKSGADTWAEETGQR